MKTITYSLILAVVLILFESHPVFSGEDHARHAGAEQPVGPNPLIEEMIMLDGVFRDVVSAVALGDGERTRKALESMHGAMEKTHEGVHAGTVILPKNNERMKEFVSLDKRFHEKLEALAGASRRNDQKEMLALTKQLLDRCVGCHQMFRK